MTMGLVREKDLGWGRCTIKRAIHKTMLTCCIFEMGARWHIKKNLFYYIYFCKCGTVYRLYKVLYIEIKGVLRKHIVHIWNQFKYTLFAQKSKKESLRTYDRSHVSCEVRSVVSP